MAAQGLPEALISRHGLEGRRQVIFCHSRKLAFNDVQLLQSLQTFHWLNFSESTISKVFASLQLPLKKPITKRAENLGTHMVRETHHGIDHISSL